MRRVGRCSSEDGHAAMFPPGESPRPVVEAQNAIRTYIRRKQGRSPVVLWRKRKPIAAMSIADGRWTNSSERPKTLGDTIFSCPMRPVGDQLRAAMVGIEGMPARRRRVILGNILCMSEPMCI
jgi:hypothetical protein